MFTKIPKHWTVLLAITLFLLILFKFPSSVLATSAFPNVSSQSASIASIFSPPLGYSDGEEYGPRFTYDNGGSLIENTDYGIQNPDLNMYSNCFQMEMRYLLHTGEDWYRSDGESTSLANVTAVADGVVTDYNPAWDYPGEAVVIEHTLPSGQKIHSVYMHLNEDVSVSVGQVVYRGQRIGTIKYQPYTGRHPEYHPSGDDSHLHFEMRYFASAASIYYDHPACNKGDAPGRGYTYPGYPPDTYPNSSQHYTDPAMFVQSHAGVFLPLIIKQEPPCNQGSALIANGNFEQGRVYWIEQGLYPIVRTDTPFKHGGSWAAWLAGYDNADDVLYQTFYVPNGATSASLVYYVRIGTDETSSGAYDYLRVRLRSEAGSLLSTIDTLNDNSTKNTWLRRSYTVNLGSYVGQIFRLSFEATTDGTLTTNFYVDDVSLTLNCGTTSGNSQEGSESEEKSTQEVESNYPAVQPRKPTPTPNPYP
jgi:murein DD-endopeptidase MepM/ murein hydrolase activator NlpD